MDIAHAVDIVQAVHTLDIAIAIVIVIGSLGSLGTNTLVPHYKLAVHYKVQVWNNTLALHYKLAVHYKSPSNPSIESPCNPQLIL